MVDTFLATRRFLHIMFVCSAARRQTYNWSGALVSSRVFISTFKKSQSCVATSDGKTRREEHFLLEEGYKKVPVAKTAILLQMHWLSRQNMWQEAFRLFSCNSQNQHKVEKNAVSIESLIAAFLFYGYDQSALLIWRAASTYLNFVPSSMLVLKLAVYNILVNGKGQESMVLAKKMNHENGEVLYKVQRCQSNETDLHECIKLWIGLYGSLQHSSPVDQIEDNESVEASLLAMWRLALLPQVDEAIHVDQMQYLFHVIYAMTSAGFRLKEMLPIGNLKAEFLYLFFAVDLITSSLGATSAITTAQLTEKLIPPVNTLPFLLCNIFPISIGYTPETSHKIIVTGLTQYQIFSHGDGKWTSSATVGTVGAVWMNELWNRGLDELFLRNVVTHDITMKEKPPLMVQLLLVPSKMLSPTVCSILGQKIFSVVESAFKHFKAAQDEGKHKVTISTLALEYISRVLTPFIGPINIRERHPSTGVPKHLYSDCIATSLSFYLELLGSLITKVHRIGVLWERLIESVVDQIRTLSTCDGALIPFQWLCQMHQKSWFPALLDISDPERERKLSIALQQDTISVLEGGDTFMSWNSAVGAALRILHEQWCNDDVLHWTYSIDVFSQQRVRGCHFKKFQMRRALVQCFVRWEWLLEGLWELMRSDMSSAREKLRCDLLRVCISTLDRCRKFHRSDIARDLLHILFLPTAPFIGLLPVKFASGRLFTLLTGELKCEGERESDACSKQTLEWQLLSEIFRWLPSLRVWKIMDKLQERFLSVEHVSVQRFHTFRFLIEDLSSGWRRRRRQSVESCGASECERVRCVAALYEKASRVDLSLRTPQLLLPLLQALRTAGLMDEMTTLLQRTFAGIQKGFYAPHYASVARRVEDALLFFYGFHEEAESLCNSSHTKAKGMISTVAETYLFSRWERGDYTAVERMLLKPLPENSATMSVPFTHESITSGHSEKICLEERDVPFLLPVAEREALRILFVLFIAHHKGTSRAIAAIRRLPASRVDPSRTFAYVQRITKQETKLFASCTTMAMLVVSGEVRLRDACVSLAKENTAMRGNPSYHRSEDSQKKEPSVDAESSTRSIRTLKDLNQCIDRCDWALALEAIPHILKEPLHMTRKALLACEKTPVKGTAWEGAMTIFANAIPKWKAPNSRAQHSFGSKSSERNNSSTKTSRCYAVGLQECGRIMTILADGKRWREALQVFESLASFGVDGYIFTQACFALGVGGRPDLAVDLWAMWRAAVGDAVTPTPSMCAQLVRCGVMGNEAIANAACTMIQTASEGTAQTPGTELPLSFEKEEHAVVALLRDRWHESWQEALRVALASGRPRIIESVAWRSPRNHCLYEAVVNQARQEERVLSVTERSAIATHLDLVGVLDAKESDPQVHAQKDKPLVQKGVVEDNAARVLRELLGDDVT